MGPSQKQKEAKGLFWRSVGKGILGQYPDYLLALCQLHGVGLLRDLAQNNSLLRQHADCGQAQKALRSKSSSGEKKQGDAKSALKGCLLSSCFIQSLAGTGQGSVRPQDGH